MPRTARQILTRAIRDIEDGKWKKGELLQDGPDVPSTYLPPKCDIYMGCALGLVAMHGGHGGEITKGRWKGYFEVKYPDASAPPGVRKAVAALNAALPKRRQAKVSEFGTEPDSDPDGDPLNMAVYRYNDQPSTNRQKALQWFQDALESL